MVHSLAGQAPGSQEGRCTKKPCVEEGGSQGWRGARRLKRKSEPFKSEPHMPCGSWGLGEIRVQVGECELGCRQGQVVGVWLEWRYSSRAGAMKCACSPLHCTLLSLLSAFCTPTCARTCVSRPLLHKLIFPDLQEFLENCVNCPAAAKAWTH